jgi:putative tryptophan/tyrosine transport system substrate-binding protein
MKERPDGLVVVPDPLLGSQAARVEEFLAKNRLPAIFGGRTGSGLMSYGIDYGEHVRSAAAYVDKILRGANPADLPVEQPTKFELVINMRTAKALGLTIPQSILVRADEIIQ